MYMLMVFRHMYVHIKYIHIKKKNTSMQIEYGPNQFG